MEKNVTVKRPALVFLSGPITQLKDKHTGMIDEKSRKSLGAVLKFLGARHHLVFSAHEIEKWGKLKMLPERAAKRDFDAVKAADVFIANLYYPKKSSSGAALELGAAIALSHKKKKRNIKIIFLQPESVKIDSDVERWVNGLQLTKDWFEIIKFKDTEDLKRKLEPIFPMPKQKEKFIGFLGSRFRKYCSPRRRGARYFR